MESSRIQQLMKQREELENEADLIKEILLSPGPNGEPPAGLKDPLVDSEGYPRNDIDLYEIRRKRNRLAVINTDYKNIMKEIEQELHKIYSKDDDPNNNIEVKDEAATVTTTSINEMPTNDLELKLSETNLPQVPPKSTIALPFAIIDEILPNSPAQVAGLLDGDELIKFGSVDGKMFNPLSYLPNIVTTNVNHPINLIIRRNGIEIPLTLTPHTWSGRGLLGCHFTPI